MKRKTFITISTLFLFSMFLFLSVVQAYNPPSGDGTCCCDEGSKCVSGNEIIDNKYFKSTPGPC